MSDFSVINVGVSNNYIILYSLPNFAGTHTKLTNGEYTFLRLLGLNVNRIGSLKISPFTSLNITREDATGTTFTEIALRNDLPDISEIPILANGFLFNNGFTSRLQLSVTKTYTPNAPIWTLG